MSRPLSWLSMAPLSPRGPAGSTAATFLGTCDLTALASGQLTPEEERAKVCTIVVGINVLAPLEKAYHQVCKWRSHDLISNLEDPLRQNSSEHQLRRNDSPKSDADKD